jgi:hypothetical protein
MPSSAFVSSITRTSGELGVNEGSPSSPTSCLNHCNGRCGLRKVSASAGLHPPSVPGIHARPSGREGKTLAVKGLRTAGRVSPRQSEVRDVSRQRGLDVGKPICA